MKSICMSVAVVGYCTLGRRREGCQGEEEGEEGQGRIHDTGGIFNQDGSWSKVAGHVIFGWQGDKRNLVAGENQKDGKTAIMI